MKTKTGLSLLCLVCLSLAAPGCQRAPRDRANIAMLVDVSGSQTLNCDCLVATAKQSRAWPNVRQQSVLWLAQTGNEASAFEPRLVLSFPLPRVKVLEGREASAAQQDQLLKQLEANCGQLAPANVSPIFAGIKRMTEQLQTAPLSAGGSHYLIVKTDGLETAEPALRTALEDDTVPLAGLPKIDNRQVKVIFRGLAETVRQGDLAKRPARVSSAQQADRVRAVWRAAFTHPDAVVFEPLCLVNQEPRLAQQPAR